MSNLNILQSVDDNIGIQQTTKTAGLGGQVSTNVSQLIQPIKPLLDIDETQKSILEKIKDFPISKKTIETLKKITTTEITNEELFNEIKSEPTITPKVLKIANSPMYGQGKIPTIERAMIFLGFKIVYKMLASCLVSHEVDVDMSPYGIVIDKFAELSGNQCALLDKWKDPKINNVKGDIQLASFLQEVGKIVIAMIITENKLTNVFEGKIKEYGDISQAEEYVLGLTSSEITALVFSKWNLDKEMVEYIRYSDKPENAPEKYIIGSQALKIIKTLSPISKDGINKDSLSKSIELANSYGFDGELLNSTVNIGK